MAAVTELGYVGLQVKNLEAWETFAGAVLGLEVARDAEPGRRWLRMDYWHHRIALYAGDHDELCYIGLRVAGPDEFQEIQRQLSDAGVACRAGSREEALSRHVLELVRLEDPEGNPVEIFHGPEIQLGRPFYPGRPMHGRFKTGSGGLGHVMLRARDLAAAYRFYRRLGMRGGIEYRLDTGKRTIEPVFMHCNEREHSVAFGLGDPRYRISHLMVEADNFDDVWLTYELVLKHELEVVLPPGRHANDRMFSFYVRNPSGWLLEYGWGGAPAAAQSEYYTEDIYGHLKNIGGPRSSDDKS